MRRQYRAQERSGKLKKPSFPEITALIAAIASLLTAAAALARATGL
jgi:hypothetical protein